MCPHDHLHICIFLCTSVSSYAVNVQKRTFGFGLYACAVLKRQSYTAVHPSHTCYVSFLSIPSMNMDSCTGAISVPYSLSSIIQKTWRGRNHHNFVFKQYYCRSNGNAYASCNLHECILQVFKMQTFEHINHTAVLRWGNLLYLPHNLSKIIRIT